ncbi:heavy-metal-associated domain-containing protein [Clostridium arbusti]|jgi:copper chaperone CopZ|uniref:heavy-metal-associated domain-containing protein n=1 Tax=Clostridium arbusti TaxID=1137848 RepID=UPI000287C633|nr:heavy-metal-associated domain-containing protein [Clostridium arbusti]
MKCKKVKFKVDGVSCLDCFSSLLETMERVAGIAETSIELDSKIATMHYEPNRISKEQIRSIIETIPQSDFRATLMI